METRETGIWTQWRNAVYVSFTVSILVLTYLFTLVWTPKSRYFIFWLRSNGYVGRFFTMGSLWHRFWMFTKFALESVAICFFWARSLEASPQWDAAFWLFWAMQPFFLSWQHFLYKARRFGASLLLGILLLIGSVAVLALFIQSWADGFTKVPTLTYMFSVLVHLYYLGVSFVFWKNNQNKWGNSIYGAEKINDFELDYALYKEAHRKELNTAIVERQKSVGSGGKQR